MNRFERAHTRVSTHARADALQRWLATLEQLGADVAEFDDVREHLARVRELEAQRPDLIASSVAERKRVAALVGAGESTIDDAGARVHEVAAGVKDAEDEIRTMLEEATRQAAYRAWAAFSSRGGDHLRDLVRPVIARIISDTEPLLETLDGVLTGAQALKRPDTAAAWSQAATLEQQWDTAHRLVHEWRAEMWLDQDGRYPGEYTTNDTRFLGDHVPRDLPRSSPKPERVAGWLWQMRTRQPGLYTVREVDKGLVPVSAPPINPGDFRP